MPVASLVASSRCPQSCRARELSACTPDVQSRPLCLQTFVSFPKMSYRNYEYVSSIPTVMRALLARQCLLGTGRLTSQLISRAVPSPSLLRPANGSVLPKMRCAAVAAACGLFASVSCEPGSPWAVFDTLFERNEYNMLDRCQSGASLALVLVELSAATAHARQGAASCSDTSAT